MALARLRAVALGVAVLALVTTTAHAATTEKPSSPVRVAASHHAPPTSGGAATAGRRAAAGDVIGGGTTCSYGGTVIACSDPSYGYWNSSDGCYWNLLVPQPPDGSTLWLGNSPKAGKLYHRTCFTDGGLGVGVLGQGIGFSSIPPPGYGGVAGTVDQLLALKAIVALGILGPIVSTAPSSGGSGLVGLPVWMWQTPTLLTWGPLGLGVRVLSLGVGITALGAQVDWYMGDGHDVICGIGTAYAVTTGQKASPDCGYVYTRPSADQPGGHYTVTAAATWNVTWQIGIDTGSLTIVRATTVPLTIHELQVVNQ